MKEILLGLAFIIVVTLIGATIEQNYNKPKPQPKEETLTATKRVGDTLYLLQEGGFEVEKFVKQK